MKKPKGFMTQKEYLKEKKKEEKQEKKAIRDSQKAAALLAKKLAKLKLINPPDARVKEEEVEELQAKADCGSQNKMRQFLGTKKEVPRSSKYDRATSFVHEKRKEKRLNGTKKKAAPLANQPHSRRQFCPSSMIRGTLFYATGSKILPRRCRGEGGVGRPENRTENCETELARESPQRSIPAHDAKCRQ